MVQQTFSLFSKSLTQGQREQETETNSTINITKKTPDTLNIVYDDGKQMQEG